MRWKFGTKRDANKEWRTLHNEELHGLHRSPNVVKVIKSKRLKWARDLARMEEGRSAFKTLRSELTGKILLGKPRRRLEDNIIMDLEEKKCKGLD